MEQMPNDVLENLMKNINDRAKNCEFKFNDHLSCDSSFYDAIKNYLISAGMFNPQTDKITISSLAKEPYHFDVKIVKQVYEFDLTIEPPQGDKNE
jgi:hypothetical protein